MGDKLRPRYVDDLVPLGDGSDAQRRRALMYSSCEDVTTSKFKFSHLLLCTLAPFQLIHTTFSTLLRTSLHYSVLASTALCYVSSASDVASVSFTKKSTTQQAAGRGKICKKVKHPYLHSYLYSTGSTDNPIVHEQCTGS